MSDQDDTRHTPTIEAPPPSEPATNTEASPSPLIPKAPGLPREELQREVKEGDSYFATAARDFAASLVEMRGMRSDIANGFRDQEAKQAERHAETTANDQLVASAIRAHGDRLMALERGQEHTAEGMAELKEDIRLARAAADEAVRLARSALETVAKLESRLPKANAPAPASSSTPSIG